MMVEINVNYSLFATDDGEYFTGSGQWTVEDFADFIAGTLKDSLVILLHENPYKVFSLIMDCEKVEMENHQPKTKAAIEVSDIKLLKMLKALDNPIRLEIVNFILSKQGEAK